MKTIVKGKYENELLKFLHSTLPFFNELTPKQKQQLVDNCILRSYEPFETVHNSINLNYGLYLVANGILQGYSISHQGREFSLYAAGSEQSSSFFCSAVDISDECTGMDFRTLHKTELVFIPHACWQQLIDRSLPASRYALSLQRRTMGVIVNSLQSSVFLPAEKKLLLHIWEKHTLSPSKPTITQTHEEIAYIIGTSRETVSRSLQKLQKQGLLRIGHGKLEILNPTMLYSLISEFYSQ
ncbi:MAG: Crp/Fnr family transcriptional regulator [Oscillospiraceae bacterium]|nr:Crp/Fnr family transcriptional regulator [Oscillospiraceae bacterium]